MTFVMVRSLCGHALNVNADGSGGCFLGDQCEKSHPVDVRAATMDHKKKKTLKICSFFDTPDGCINESCEFLHVRLLPKKEMRLPPSGPTPSRPISSGPARASNGRRQFEARRPPEARRQSEARRPPEGPQPKVLDTLAKLEAQAKNLVKSSKLFRELHKQLPQGDCKNKADKADKMLAHLDEKLVEINNQVDSWLAGLAAGESVEYDDSEL